MYNERAYKNEIFWMRVKRIFLILVFSTIGAFIGILIRDYLVNVIKLDESYKAPIVILSTFLMLSIALLLTAGTGREIQDAYWKMAVLRKLIIISKKLDNVSIVANDELDEMVGSLNDLEIAKNNIEIPEEVKPKKSLKLKKFGTKKEEKNKTSKKSKKEKAKQ